MLPALREEARKRQDAAATRGCEGGRGNTKTLPPDSGEGFPSAKHSGEAIVQAAKIVGVGAA